MPGVSSPDPWSTAPQEEPSISLPGRTAPLPAPEYDKQPLDQLISSPGSVGVPSVSAATTHDLEDLGLDLDEGFATDSLSFIEDAQSRMPNALREEAPIAQSEWTIRHRNGRIEGPYGTAHIKALIRDGTLSGGEDISEDKVIWRAISSYIEFSETINAVPPPSPPTKNPNRSSMDELLGSLDIPSSSVEAVDDPTPLPRFVSNLVVDDLPDSFSPWHKYKKIIYVAAAIICISGAGYAAYVIKPWRALGRSETSDFSSSNPQPSVAAEPPPSQPSLNLAHIRQLIHRRTFTGLNQAITRLSRANTFPSEQLLAEAYFWGSLTFGPDHFPLELTQRAITKIATHTSSTATALQAGLSLLKGDTKSALSSLKKASEQHPDEADILYLLGIAYEKSGQTQPARQAYNQAITTRPSLAAAYEKIGDLLRASSDPEALRWYEKAVGAHEAAASAALKLAELYEEGGHVGAQRRTLALASTLASAMPPELREPVMLKTVQMYDDVQKLEEVSEIALKLEQMAPNQPESLGYGAIAQALKGETKPAISRLNRYINKYPTQLELLLARARVLMLEGDIAKTLLDLEKAQQIDTGVQALIWQARFHMRLGKTKDVKRFLDIATKRVSDDPRPYVELAKLALREGRIDDAYATIETALDFQPRYAQGLIIKGQTLMQRGELKAAQDIFRLANTYDDEDINAKLGQATALREQGAEQSPPQTSEALAQSLPIYRECLESHPQNPLVLFEYGRALELQGQFAEALELYRKAASMDKKDVRPHLKIMAAQLSKTPPDLESALESLKQAQTIERNLGQLKAEVRFGEAKLFIAKGHPAQAVASMRRATQIEPKNAIYQHMLGQALEKNSALFEAISAYKRAINLNHRFSLAYRDLGHAELERFKFAEARRNFRMYLKIEPKDATIWFDIGESYSRQNRDRQALKAFNKVLQHIPDHGETLLHLGQILSRRGQETKAQRMFRKVTKVDPNNGEGWCMLGLSLGQTRLSSDAKKALNKCIKSPKSPTDLVDAARELLN